MLFSGYNLVNHCTDGYNKGFFVDGSPMKEIGPTFSYGVACYPEKHEEAPNIATDAYWFKKKGEME